MKNNVVSIDEGRHVLRYTAQAVGAGQFAVWIDVGYGRHFTHIHEAASCEAAIAQSRAELRAVEIIMNRI